MYCKAGNLNPTKERYSVICSSTKSMKEKEAVFRVGRRKDEANALELNV